MESAPGEVAEQKVHRCKVGPVEDARGRMLRRRCCAGRSSKAERCAVVECAEAEVASYKCGYVCLTEMEVRHNFLFPFLGGETRVLRGDQ